MRIEVMSKGITTIIYLLFITVIGSTILSPLITFNNISPDFLMIVIVMIALSEGVLLATLVGFLFGLIMDISQPELIGLHALCCSFTGFAIGNLRGRLVMDSIIVSGGLVALAVFSYETIYSLVASVVVGNEFIRPFFMRVIPSAIFSGLVAIPISGLSMLLGLFDYED
jgi:rod shape-determining protein MreD